MGKTALVTGAGMGLGKAIAERLTADGMTVIVADIDEAAGKDVASALGNGATFMSLDVSKEAEWLSVFDDIRKQFGSLQVLVNNAGITTMGSIEDLTFEAFKHEIEVDLYGVFLGCKHALAVMKETGGAIINMSSASGLRAREDLAGYNAAKAAVTMLTKAVALQYAKSGYGISVNSVHPGAIQQFTPTCSQRSHHRSKTVRP